MQRRTNFASQKTNENRASEWQDHLVKYEGCQKREIKYEKINDFATQ